MHFYMGCATPFFLQICTAKTSYKFLWRKGLFFYICFSVFPNNLNNYHKLFISKQNLPPPPLSPTMAIGGVEDLRGRAWNLFWENRIRLEIAAHCTLSSLLGYSLGVADIPEVVPPSVASYTSWLGSLFVTMLPALMFSALGKVFSQFFVAVFSLAALTALLVISAEGGDGALTAGFAGFALWIAGLRFYTNNSSLASFITMLIAPWLFDLYKSVQEPGGIDLIKSYWTESGTQNPLAFMQSILIAYGWIILVASFNHYLPPWRTAREDILVLILPRILKDNARYIRCGLAVDSPWLNDLSPIEGHDKEQGHVGGLGIDYHHNPVSLPTREDPYITSRYKMLGHVLILADGKLAALTAFEPMFRFFRPVSTWVVLKEVMISLQKLTLQNMASLRFSAGPRKEYEEVAETLEYCAEILKGTVVHRTPFPRAVEMKEFRGWEDGGDPFLLKERATVLRNAVEKWAHAVGGGVCAPIPDDVNMGWFTTIKLNLFPFLVSWLGLYKNLFWDIPKRLLTPSSYTRLFDWRNNTDWIKAVAIVKFALGVTCLFIMRIYWEEYAEFAVPTGDQPGNHFSGWETIAFVMASTQTTEGTVKKGMLRLLGTCFGGFSGWLALTACTSTGENGEDEINPFGLVAWLCSFQFLALLIPFEKGPKARLGMTPDYAYGVQNFILTQAVISIYAFNGAGTKNDLVANRVVANCCGIGMSMLIALIPPQNLAGSPRNARVILELQEAKVLNLLRLVRALADGAGEERIEEGKKIHKKLKKEIGGLFEESNDFIKDASRLPKFPVLRIDPGLKKALGSLMVLDAFIDHVLCDLVVEAIENPEVLQQEFREGTEQRKKLEDLERELVEEESGGRGEEKGEEAIKVQWDGDRLGLDIMVPFLIYYLSATRRHKAILNGVRSGLFNTRSNWFFY